MTAANHGGNAYWPEIDGLRAVAILLVVGFHAGIRQLSGGFIGVDVFFVISGYLITGLLIRELDRNGRIDLLDFFARRVRRLLPALAIVLVATLAAGAAFLVPVGEQQQLSQSAIAASAFVANLFFWRSQASYFAGPADEIPLLHLWTLAVEEQFYIVWPLTMMAVAAAAKWRSAVRLHWIAATLVVGSLLSFAACWWFTPSRSTLTFYTMPFRAWEFGLGALLSLVGSSVPRAAKSPFESAVSALLIAGGLAAIVSAALLFNRNTLFPGFAAALPAVGTTAAIAGLRAARDSLPSRLLSARPMVAIGKLSYSWYLWHWPLLAIARAATPGHVSVPRDLSLVLIALGLAAVTFRFVEEPVRRRRPWPLAAKGSAIAAGIGMMCASSGLAAVLWTRAESQVARDPILKAAQLARTESFALNGTCANFRLPFTGLASPEACTIGGKKTATDQSAPLVLLWGDSHAHHYLPGLVHWAEQTGVRLLPRTMGACKPQVNSVPVGLSSKAETDARSCVAFNAAVAGELSQLKAVGAIAVVLAARWSQPSQLQNGLGDWPTDLGQRIQSIRQAGLGVVVLAETPNPMQFVPSCVARHGADGCTRERSAVDAERAGTLNALHGLMNPAGGIELYDPIAELCSATSCPALHNGVVNYSDDSHLSVQASKSLASSLGLVLGPIVGAGRR